MTLKAVNKETSRISLFCIFVKSKLICNENKEKQALSLTPKFYLKR